MIKELTYTVSLADNDRIIIEWNIVIDSSGQENIDWYNVKVTRYKDDVPQDCLKGIPAAFLKFFIDNESEEIYGKDWPIDICHRERVYRRIETFLGEYAWYIHYGQGIPACFSRKPDNMKKITDPKTKSKDQSLPTNNREGNLNQTEPIFQPIIFFNQIERPKETQFYETIKNAKKFYFMARSGVTFFTRYTSAIIKAIECGCECRFIILNKDSLIIKMGKFETAFDEGNIILALSYIKNIKDTYPDKVEIHLCDFYPTFDIEYFENIAGEKTIVVQTHFIASHFGPDRPMFMLKEGDYWFSTFLDEFTAIWNKTNEWNG